MNKHPLVSIVMANWNGGSVLGDCLDSLTNVTYPNFEVIIVDNASSDNSLEIVQKYKRKLKLDVIKNKWNTGFAPANNQGFEYSKGKYILLLNNDTTVDAKFLRKLVDRIDKDEHIGALQPKIYMMDNPGFLDNAGSFLTRIGFLHHWGFNKKDSDEFAKERQVFSIKGACMLVRREVIEHVGLFDASFGSYFEESDFCWRVNLAGYKVIYFPDTFIYHKVGFTIKRLDVLTLNFQYYRNRITSLIKNLEIKNIFLILFPHILISIGIAVAFLAFGKPKNSFLIIRAIWWNLSHLREILIKRKEVQTIRKVSDKVLFEKLSWSINWRDFFKDFLRVKKDIDLK